MTNKKGRDIWRSNIGEQKTKEHGREKRWHQKLSIETLTTASGICGICRRNTYIIL